MRTIVIISEDYIFLKLLEPLLISRIPDCTIIHCNSFTEVKSKIDKNNCDLIVADGVMSGVASYEIINHLRVEMKITVPIYFISEVNIEYFRLKAIEAGASIYYNKPFNPYEVTEAIVNAIKTSEK